MLGHEERPIKNRGEWQNKFEGKAAYARLLNGVFAQSAELLADRSVVYVRTDKRDFTLKATLAALRAAFPGRREIVMDRPYKGPTQTHLFGDCTRKPGEVDIVLTL
jgi:hypothetical protein